MEDIDLKHLKRLLVEIKQDIKVTGACIPTESKSLTRLMIQVSVFMSNVQAIDDRLLNITEIYEECTSIISETYAEFLAMRKQAMLAVETLTKSNLDIDQLNAEFKSRAPCRPSILLAFDGLNKRLDAAISDRGIPIALYLDKEYNIILKME